MAVEVNVEEKDNQVSQQQTDVCVYVGEIITLAIDEVEVKCVTAVDCENKPILIPLDNQSLFESVQEGSTLQFDTPRGVVDEYTTVPAINGTFVMQPAIENRREYYRINYTYDAELSAGSGSWTAIKGEDLSEGGLLAVCDGSIDLSLGQTVVVRLSLPDCPVLTAIGVIRRIEKPKPNAKRAKSKIAIEFTTLDSKDRQRLVEFIYRYQIKNAPCR